MCESLERYVQPITEARTSIGSTQRDYLGGELSSIAGVILVNSDIEGELYKLDLSLELPVESVQELDLKRVLLRTNSSCIND